MNTTTHPSTLSPTDVHGSQQDLLLLDVRTPAKFEETHIPGSVLHPLSKLSPDHVRDLANGKDACVVICHSGNRARQAADKLARHGIPDVHVLDGGVESWASVGLPIEHGQKTMSLKRRVRIAAGALVVAGATLGYLVHPAWIALPTFVGAGLVFAGFTDTCGMGMLLARMPWNNRRACAA